MMTKEIEVVSLAGRIIQQRDEARDKALDSLGRYKFQMFGYWAAIWVHLNHIIGDGQANPFSHLVKTAKADPRLIKASIASAELGKADPFTAASEASE